MISAHAPEAPNEYQQLEKSQTEHGDGICSELEPEDDTGMELSDTETVLPPTASTQRKWEVGTPLRNPLQYLQQPQGWSPAEQDSTVADPARSASAAGEMQPSPTPDFGNAEASLRATNPASPMSPVSVASPLAKPASVPPPVDVELAAQIRALRSEYTAQAQNLRHRLELVEKVSRPLEEADSREDHLEYLRKWVENLVTNVCAAHPSATESSVLLHDFQMRLRNVLQVPEPGESRRLNEDNFSPVNPDGRFEGSEPATCCCTIS